MSTHHTHVTHPNALAAYYAGTDGLFSNREVEVLRILRRTPGLTDREVALAMRSQDPNRSRPRITALLKSGVLEECGDAQDPISGKTVRRTRVRANPSQPQRQFSFDLPPFTPGALATFSGTDMAMGGDDGSP